MSRAVRDHRSCLLAARAAGALVQADPGSSRSVVSKSIRSRTQPELWLKATQAVIEMFRMKQIAMVGILGLALVLATVVILV